MITCNTNNLVDELASLVDIEMVKYLRKLTEGTSPPTEKMDAVISKVYPQLLLDQPELSDREKLDLMGLHRLGQASTICEGLEGYIGIFYCPTKENLAALQKILLAAPYINFRESLGVSRFLVAYPKPGSDWRHWDFDSFCDYIYSEIANSCDSSDFPALLSVELI